MKQEFFTCGLVVAFVTSMSTTGFAGDFDQYIHLVKHRDVHGNLVVPEHLKVPQTKQTQAPQTTGHVHETSHAELQMPSSVENNTAVVSSVDSDEEMVSEIPHASQPDSHVEPSPVAHPVSEPVTTLNGEVTSHALETSHEESLIEPPVENDAAVVSQVDSDEEMTHHEHTVPQAVSHVEPVPMDQAMSEPHAMPYEETASMEEAVEEVPNDEAAGNIKKTMLPFQPGSYTFRSTNWGMSIPEVKTNETADFLWELDSPTLMAGEHRLGYRTSVEDVETVLTYAFENDRLINAKYVFETEEVENDAQPLSDYKKVKNWIIQTYGPPQSEEKLWVNELYQYAPELWGRALMRGHLTMVSEWNIDGTSIVLLINGGDESVGLIAEFSNTAHTPATKLVHLPPSFFAL